MKNTELKNFFAIFENLSDDDKRNAVDMILAKLQGSSDVAESSKETKRPDCPHCGAEASLGFIYKRGFSDGKQRYQCKSCGKIFYATTNTMFAHTRKSDLIWRKAIELTLKGATIREVAEECEICLQTSFVWRHKLLKVFIDNQENTTMLGRVEMDEMFIRISEKGNHIKGAFNSKRKRGRGVDNGLGRRAFKRGTDNRSTAPESKACVVCMVGDKNKSFYAITPNIGYLQPYTLDWTLAKHVNKETALVLCDNNINTTKYLKSNNYTFKSFKSNKSKNRNKHKPETDGDLHIQHVNAFHHNIRDFLRKYRGVSTKYLNGYLSMYVWFNSLKASKQTKKLVDKSIALASNSYSYISGKQLKELPSIPVCA